MSLLGKNLVHRGLMWLPSTILAASSLLIPVEVSAEKPPISVVQITNQAEPGTGFFVEVAGKIIFITAKHVIGASGESITLSLVSGPTINVPLKNQFPISGLDATVVIIDGPINITPLVVSDKLPVLATPLTVWGFPVTDKSTRPTITSRTGPYLGSPNAIGDGYSLLYGASTQVGFSGGPILDGNGKVVGMHGRSESRRAASGQSERTGNALGIPISSIIASILKSSGSAASAIDQKSLQDQASAASISKVIEIFAQSSFSDQVLSELDRASLGKIPPYCIEMARAYYYTFYSALPNLSKATGSLSISKQKEGVEPAYYAFAGLIAQKSADYARKLQYDRILERMNQSSYLQYSERRLQGEVQSALTRCKPSI